MSYDLPALCTQVRRDILEMTHAAGSGHPGGSLSAVEILVSLYFDQMKLDPAKPQWADRDRMILSKGHAAPVLYSVLARRGFFDPALLSTLRQMGSPLQGHPHMEKLAGLDCSSGSLGQGLSVANGLALAAKRLGKDYRTYCLMGDGEVQEGQVWEAAMTAAHFGLDNVCAIVDDNGVQLDGLTKDIMNVEPLDEKFRAFGWHVISVDGHDLAALQAARPAAVTPLMAAAAAIFRKPLREIFSMVCDSFLFFFCAYEQNFFAFLVKFITFTSKGKEDIISL